MIHRYPIVLTSMKEDFQKIGLLPEEELTEDTGYEGQHLMEVDDPRNPRDIPSPDPSTMGGKADRQRSINRRARHSTATQPRPKVAPDEKNDHDDALQAGATQGGKSAGSYNKKPNYREEYEYDEDDYEEGMEQGPDQSHGYSQYKIVAKTPGMDDTDSKHSDRGKSADKAQGNSPTKKIGGMGEASSLRRAADLIGEVEALVHGARVDEETDDMARGFMLIGENSAILADRLAEISDVYEVEHVIDAMEDLSRAAIEALDIIEAKASFQADKRAAIATGKWMPEEDEEEVEEGLKEAFQAMTLDLMDAVESYDEVLE